MGSFGQILKRRTGRIEYYWFKSWRQKDGEWKMNGMAPGQIGNFSRKGGEKQEHYRQTEWVIRIRQAVNGITERTRPEPRTFPRAEGDQNQPTGCVWAKFETLFQEENMR